MFLVPRGSSSLKTRDVALVEAGLLDVNMGDDQEVLANLNVRFTLESGHVLCN
jgi:hypothetical protein